MRSRLLWKLLGINVLVICTVILMVWLAFDYLAADYFVKLMEEYNIAPEALNRIFRASVHRYLLAAGLVALVLAVVLSLFLMRRTLRPLLQMMAITRNFAAGDYSARVRLFSQDEIGLLGAAFNQMADCMHQLEQLRRTVLVNVAHELRTPLTNIRGYLEALRDGVMAPSKEVFESLHEETLRLTQFSEDLIQLARAEGARTALQRNPVRLRELVLQTLELFRPRLAARNIAVETDLDAAAASVSADAEKLTQVIINLLENAWQYTPSGGAVRVAAEPLPERIKITFANTGPGIAEENVPFIFERFYRGEESRSREYGGAGLGLAIVKGLIEAHGGEVGADSSSTETRIWFRLPM